jgi:hypothetical protein
MRLTFEACFMFMPRRKNNRVEFAPQQAQL